MYRKIENLEIALRYMMEEYNADPIKPLKNKLDVKWRGKAGAYYVRIEGKVYVVRFRRNVFEVYAKHYKDMPFDSKGCGINKSEVLLHKRESDKLGYIVFCLEVFKNGDVFMISPDDVIDFVVKYKTIKKLPDMQDTIYNVPIAIMMDFDEYLKTQKYVSWKEKFNKDLGSKKQKTLFD